MCDKKCNPASLGPEMQGVDVLLSFWPCCTLQTAFLAAYCPSMCNQLLEANSGSLAHPTVPGALPEFWVQHSFTLKQLWY